MAAVLLDWRTGPSVLVTIGEEERARYLEVTLVFVLDKGQTASGSPTLGQTVCGSGSTGLSEL